MEHKTSLAQNMHLKVGRERQNGFEGGRKINPRELFNSIIRIEVLWSGTCGSLARDRHAAGGNVEALCGRLVTVNLKQKEAIEFPTGAGRPG
jgi:hypothetical protein